MAVSLDLAEELLDKSRKIAVIWSDLDKTTSKTDISQRAAKTLIRMVISVFQDTMKLKLQPIEDAVNFDQKEQIKKMAGRFDPEQSADKIADCYQMLHWIESSVNEKLVFEHLLLSLADSDTIHV